MRTTLEIDDRVLAAARGLARSRNIAIGRAVSELALRGLGQEGPAAESEFPMLDHVSGHVITDEMVEDARDDV